MLSEAIAGATRPGQVVTWLRGDGTPENLTGATLSGKTRNEAGVTRVIVGTLAVTDGAAGKFTWTYGAGDVVAAGTFSVQFTATFADAPTIAKTKIGEWVVEASL